MFNKRPRLVSAVLAAVLLVPVTPAFACTSFRIKTLDGAVLYSRTLEFGKDLKSNLAVTPRGYSFTGVTAEGKPGGMTWTAKYAVAGAISEKKLDYVDGVNERGLTGGLLYFPGFAEYSDVKPDEHRHTMAAWQLLTWILTSFATVDEVRAALPAVKVNKAVWAAWDYTLPAHFIVHDASGASIVIEYTNGGKLNVYDNPVGVLTNSPTFDWHITNLRNYLGLSPYDPRPETISGVSFAPLGEGGGMRGLPGDVTPPSRFVRAVAFSQSMPPVRTVEEGVKYAFHTLNQFDIPYGSARSGQGDQTHIEWTQWTAVSDLKNMRYYIKTFDSNQTFVIDLKEEDLDASEPKIISLNRPDAYVKLSARMTQAD